MTCACCGADALPAWCVKTKPKETVTLCQRCTARWVWSPAARLHDQAVRMGRWDVAGSQFENWKAVERMAA